MILPAQHIRVRCLPKYMPFDFSLDIKNMSIGDSMRVKHLEIGKEVRPLIDPEDVLVVIAKR